MPINFAALVPHPPLTIPTIGKDKTELVKSTINSFETLAEEIYHAQLDTLIIISGHGQILDSAFSINHSPKLNIDLTSFGDLTKYNTLKNNIGLSYQIREYIETRLALNLYSEENLDYGSAIPLFYLTKNLPKVKVIPINIASLNYEKHVQLGEFIKEVCFRSTDKIGIIASADLSHRLTDDAPGGFSEQGKIFDNLIIESLKEKKLNQIINISPELVKEAATCGLRSLLILIGAIKNMNYTAEVLSYEAPIGVGYLTVNFKLN
ncbi:MAG: AmmeMemoRadiSam system protein B [Candidatus Komeilibacteria bacterium]